MKGIRELFMVAVLAMTASCGGPKHEEKVPEGQISAKLINNPRTASGTPTVDPKDLPVLRFTDTLHHFGTISAGETVEYAFPFTNAGGGPLLIVGATSTCGCTVPDYPSAPIAPGAASVIKVRFNSEHKQGHILKVITINTNGNPATRYLTITADVEAKQ